MRLFRHRTSTYIYNRVSEIIYHKRYPDHPWLTRTANLIFSSFLCRSDCGLEWGSGRSTLWFAKRVKKLTSVESDLHWYNKISIKLKELNTNNVEFLFFEYDKDLEEKGKGQESAYVQVAHRFPKETFDFVLIDGVYRGACAIVAVEKIKPGGFLIIDNVNWFLPSDSHSPSSRRHTEGPISQEWAKFQALVRN